MNWQKVFSCIIDNGLKINLFLNSENNFIEVVFVLYFQTFLWH
jgi:hypothetical protein